MPVSATDSLVDTRDGHFDAATRWRELDGIGDEVGSNLRKATTIAVDGVARDQAAADENEIFGLGLRLHALNDRADAGTDVDGPRLQGQTS